MVTLAEHLNTLQVGLVQVFNVVDDDIGMVAESVGWRNVGQGTGKRQPNTFDFSIAHMKQSARQGQDFNDMTLELAITLTSKPDVERARAQLIFAMIHRHLGRRTHLEMHNEQTAVPFTLEGELVPTGRDTNRETEFIGINYVYTWTIEIENDYRYLDASVDPPAEFLDFDVSVNEQRYG